MVETPKKKTLILYSSDTMKNVAEYVQSNLEKRGHKSEIRQINGLSDLNAVTEDIRNTGSKLYDSIVVMHLVDFTLARNAGADEIPDMFKWADDVRQYIPNMVVMDNTNQLVFPPSEAIKLRQAGVPVIDWLVEGVVKKVSAAVIDKLRNQPEGASRSKPNS